MPPKKQPTRSETAPPPPAVPAPAGDEGDLPEGWTETLLSELLSRLESGSRPRGGVRGIVGGVPSIGGEHLNYDGTFNFDSIKYVPHDFASAMTRGRIRENDVLIVKDGATTGKTAFVGFNFPHPYAFVNEHVFICRPSDKIDSNFLYRFLMSKDGQDRILENFKGSAQGGINQTFSSNVVVPVAPLAEQRRIVGVLEGLLGKVATSRERLARVPQLLKRFRQSVLAAACSGKLTADWREGNEVSIEEHWGIDVALSEVCSTISDGDHLPPPKQSSGIPFLTIGNISSGSLDFSNTRFVPDDYFEKIKPERKPGNGSVLFTVVGATIGIPVLVTTDRPFCFQRHIAILKPSDALTSEYLYCLMQSHSVFRQAWDGVTGTAQPTLPLGNLRAITVSLPPLAEQHEIVRRVEQLFALADRLEAQLDAARKRVDRLTQSILAKAFRGELVTTEADLARREGRTYEPASQLLARIREQQTAAAGAPAKPRKPRKSAGDK